MMKTQSNMPCMSNVLGLHSADATLETLILVIDVSGSMDTKDWSPSRLHGAREACLALIKRKQSMRPRDQIGLVSFSDFGKVRHRPVCVGNLKKSLISAVTSLETEGATHMASGLSTAGKLLGKAIQSESFLDDPIAWLKATFITDAVHVSRDANSAQRIVLLTDGHNTGRTSPVRVAERLKAFGVTIDCIGIGGSPGDVDEKELKAIASLDDRGKPRYWFIGQPEELVETFKSLATSIRSVG